MALVNKQDSNFTELRYAVEASSGVVDSNAVWHQVEPNEYKDFGGNVTTKARNPINAGRQRKKGVVVDLDANAGFVQDVTATNSQDFMSSFVFAALRKKTEKTGVSVINSDAYTVLTGGIAFQKSDLAFAEDFTLTANNGLKVVDTGATATNVPVEETLTNATGEAGTVTRVGIQFGSGLARINATPGEFPELLLINTQAANNLDFGGNASADQTVTIGGQVYTFKVSVGATANQVKIGADASASLDNLIAAINKAAGGGSTYGSATVANAFVTASAGTGDSMDVLAKSTGAAGNAIATTTNVTAAAWDNATLVGGAGRDATTLGLIPGEFVYLGSEVTDTSFVTDENNGFARIRSIAASVITFDKTQFEMVDDNGTSKTIRMFFGHVLKNEVDRTLISKRTLQFERVLGAPDDADLAAVQGEYITRCLADEATLDGKTADILKLEATFLGGTHEVRTSAQGLKDGTRPELIESDAFNTTNDVSLIKMAVVTDGEACPTPLFAYLTDLSVTIKNNLKQNKAISVLGAFDVSPGTFEVAAEVTAYFQNVQSIALVQSNVSVTLESHFVKSNKGMTFDLPLITLSKAMAEVKQDEAVMLPLESDAATAKIIHPSLDYTLLFVYWPFLPNVAQ